MKVKLLVSRAGHNFSQIAGEVVDVDDAEAKRMIDAGQAVPVEAEKATAGPHTAAKSVKRKRKPKAPTNDADNS